MPIITNSGEVGKAQPWRGETEGSPGIVIAGAEVSTSLSHLTAGTLGSSGDHSPFSQPLHTDICPGRNSFTTAHRLF